ncbi:immunity 22 family protein [Capnocytophaga canimorsus]|uniref:immunity 22 family protein n=1 Tax=Capnocytophaga canimorsus TaxID=28188 RepID=UPI001562BC42|nr:immunity 22 family protein [Capnocytophaga canimorsus]
MYINPLERMKKIHIWIGSFVGTDKEFEVYFEQKNRVCQFCLDIGIDEYDEDLIGIIPITNYMNIPELLEKIPVDESEIPNIIIKCKDLGINKVNAVFYYLDSTISIIGNRFNQLQYIGKFNTSF